MAQGNSWWALSEALRKLARIQDQRVLRNEIPHFLRDGALPLLWSPSSQLAEGFIVLWCERNASQFMSSGDLPFLSPTLSCHPPGDVVRPQQPSGNLSSHHAVWLQRGGRPTCSLSHLLAGPTRPDLTRLRAWVNGATQWERVRTISTP